MRAWPGFACCLLRAACSARWPTFPSPAPAPRQNTTNFFFRRLNFVFSSAAAKNGNADDGARAGWKNDAVGTPGAGAGSVGRAPISASSASESSASRSRSERWEGMDREGGPPRLVDLKVPSSGSEAQKLDLLPRGERGVS